ncbi:hypothetical protein AVEN_221994-1, partial [Araneus ventricosus]
IYPPFWDGPDNFEPCQMTRTTPEPATSSANIRTTPEGGHLTLEHQATADLP